MALQQQQQLLAWRRWKPSVTFLFQRLCSQRKPYKRCKKNPALRYVEGTSVFTQLHFGVTECSKAYRFFVDCDSKMDSVLISLGYNFDEEDARCSPAAASEMKKKFDACIKVIDDKFYFPKYDDDRKYEVCYRKIHMYQDAWREVLLTTHYYQSFELQFLIIALRVKFCTTLMEWRWGEDAVHEFNSNDEEAFFERITEETPCVTITPGLYDMRTGECLVKRRCAPASVLTPT